MNIADILNPTQTGSTTFALSSPPLLSPDNTPISPLARSYGKARSRFSDFEDTIICEGVARGLTWGQISSQLPHRKRATCFNRYRTLQGIRKSRKRAARIKAVLDDASVEPLSASGSRRSSIFTPSPSPPTAKCCLPSPPVMALEEGFSKRHVYLQGLFGECHRAYYHPSSPVTIAQPSSYTSFRRPSVDITGSCQAPQPISHTYGYSRRQLDTGYFQGR